MTQATMEKPVTASSSTSSYDPYASMDATDSASSASSAPAEPQYKLVIDENVVEKISSKSAQKIDGIIDMKGNLLSRVQEGLGGDDKTKGVDADVVDEQNAKVDLDIVLEYGKSAVDVFDQIKDVIGKDIKDMTGLNVIEMTVNVVDVMTRDEYADKNGSNNDDGQSGSSNHQ